MERGELGDCSRQALGMLPLQQNQICRAKENTGKVKVMDREDWEDFLWVMLILFVLMVLI